MSAAEPNASDLLCARGCARPAEICDLCLPCETAEHLACKAAGVKQWTAEALAPPARDPGDSIANAVTCTGADGCAPDGTNASTPPILLAGSTEDGTELCSYCRGKPRPGTTCPTCARSHETADIARESAALAGRAFGRAVELQALRIPVVDVAEPLGAGVAHDAVADRAAAHPQGLGAEPVLDVTPGALPSAVVAEILRGGS